MIDKNIKALCQYAINKGLIEECDRDWAINQILDVLNMDAIDESIEAENMDLTEVLESLTAYAVEKQLCQDTQTERDLFDTKLMGLLTPRPHEVRQKFQELYEKDPQTATDWFYQFSQDTNYIRKNRIEKDKKWKYDSPYGTLDITINLSKPEKDPRDIAAAKNAPQSNYPKCQLCRTNEGYAGRVNHPARQNHRILPLKIYGSDWYFQYSPYVYYNEHCIVFNGCHVPMKVDRAAFEKMLDFVTLFPHYFVGSNADLPIVGGSILSHDHFQGGRYTFAMEEAPIENVIHFHGYEDVSCGIVQWPMSVIRLRSDDRIRLAELAECILNVWREYTDEEAFIYAETDGEKHNTITPICRRKRAAYELDLVLRNNITTKEHPMGVYHPHAQYHHIKKENIGLIEVMGLAVLPARLDKELDLLKEAILCHKPIEDDPVLGKHYPWVEELKTCYTFTEENIDAIIQKEVGSVFMKVLECAGVYARNETGKTYFMKFIQKVNDQL